MDGVNVRITDFLIKEYAVSDSCFGYFKDMSAILLMFGILLILITLILRKTDINSRYSLGALAILGFEALRFFRIGGIICIDEILFAFAGVMLGNKLGVKISKKSPRNILILMKKRKTASWTWKTLLACMCVAVFIVANIGKAEDILDAFDATDPDELRRARVENALVDKISGDYIATDDDIYNKLYLGLTNKDEMISITGYNLDTDEVHRAYVKMLSDHPEIFYATGGGKGTLFQYSMVNTYTYTFEPDYFGRRDELDAKINELNTTVDYIVSSCPYESEYEKALWVHDLLVENVDYDMNVYFTTTYTDASKYDYAFTSYGALINKKAVCAGYAKAYMLILNKMGIECGYVTGTATSDTGSGPHAWNYLKIDGTYYYTDVTWDDPVSFGFSYSSEISHNYFLISKEEISKDHELDKDQFIPEMLR